MSGPLASWVGEHSKATWRGRAVLLQYALAARPDGTPAADVSRDDLERRTGLGRETVKAGRREVVELGELIELEAPGGRGRVGRYRIAVTRCLAEVGCWSCGLLPDPRERGRHTAGFSGGGKGAATRPPSSGKGPRQPGKGPSQPRKGPPHGPTTETGNGPPLKGEPLPPGESSDRSSHAPPPSAGRARERAQVDLDELAARCPLMASIHRNWHGHLRKPAPDCPWCEPTAENIADIEAMEASSRRSREQPGLAGDEEGQG